MDIDHCPKRTINIYSFTSHNENCEVDFFIIIVSTLQTRRLNIKDLSVPFLEQFGVNCEIFDGIHKEP